MGLDRLQKHASATFILAFVQKPSNIVLWQFHFLNKDSFCLKSRRDWGASQGIWAKFFTDLEKGGATVHLFITYCLLRDGKQYSHYVLNSSVFFPLWTFFIFLFFTKFPCYPNANWRIANDKLVILDMKQHWMHGI